MTAKGKITTSEIGRRPMGTVRILITDDGRGHRASDAAISGGEVDTWYPAYNKTGMVTATVTGFEAVRGNRRSRYYLTTDRGKVNNLSPSQTFWLAPDTAADSKDKALGEMAPTERAAAIRRAAARMQAELTSNAPAISAALESVDQPAQDQTDPQQSYTTVPNRAHGVQADTTLSGSVPAGFTGSTLVGTASSGQPTVVAYVEPGDVSDKATPAGLGGEAPVRHGATVEAPPGSPAPGEIFEQQTSENGGKTWRTTATGLDAADVAATRDRDAAGEGVRWRALPETDNGLARLIAAKEAELVAARNAMEANFNRPVGGSSRTKQFGRRVDAQLRRGGQLGREVQRLQSEIRGLCRRATAPAPAPLDLSRLPYAKAIRTATGWYRVLKVNAKSVVVEVPPGWDNRFPLSRILEIRERDDAPAPAGESVGFDGSVISGPYAPRGSVRVCDVGGEQLDGPWYLISAGPAGDRTADRGASCAEHCGQPAPDAAAMLTPGPLTSVPAAFVSSWGNVRAGA
jgi:hypothetical protein